MVVGTFERRWELFLRYIIFDKRRIKLRLTNISGHGFMYYGALGFFITMPPNQRVVIADPFSHRHARCLEPGYQPQSITCGS